MALHGTSVSAFEFLLAWSSTSRWRHSALDWGIQLGDATITVQGLGGSALARLAEAKMAKLATGVLPTGQNLVAGDHAQMQAFRVTSTAHPTLHRAADLLAAMLAALLHLIADSLAFDVVDLVHLLLCHVLLAIDILVIDHVAGHSGRRLATDALLLNQLLAAHALVSMALLGALMSATGQEPLTKRVAYWYGLGAGFPLPAQ